MSVQEIKQRAAEYRRAKAERIKLLEMLLASTPAIRGMVGDHPRLALVTGELSDHDQGAYRVTYFGTDGPYGHRTRRTMHDIAIEIEDTLSPPFEPMTEAEVMAWTTTEEFVHGSLVVAYVQAENTYSWLAQKANVPFEERMATVAEARKESDARGIEAGTAHLTAAIGRLPRANPPRAGLVANPPWVTGALASAYDILTKKIPARWMPLIGDIRSRGNKLTGTFTEFGCGAYGCVLPTLDPKIVLKVTTDETEALFAERVAPDLVAPVCVEYPMVVELGAQHDGATIYLLWRQAAEHVGDVIGELGEYAADLIADQHEAAQRAYEAVFHKKSTAMIRARVGFWLEMCERIARQREVPEIRDLFTGIIEVYERQRILFGDIHTGNLGQVGTSWVITDPGNIAVLDPTL